MMMILNKRMIIFNHENHGDASPLSDETQMVVYQLAFNIFMAVNIIIRECLLASYLGISLSLLLKLAGQQSSAFQQNSSYTSGMYSNTIIGTF